MKINEYICINIADFSRSVERISSTCSPCLMNSHLYNIVKSAEHERQKYIIAARLITFKRTVFGLSSNSSTSMEANIKAMTIIRYFS